MSRLDRAFFARDTLLVARELLGCLLVRELNDRRLAGRIVEVEAYVGKEDAACHGHRGRTARNAPLFGPVGFSYVYLIYGIHWLVNVVARPAEVGDDYPAAILLRALEPLEGLDIIAARRAQRPPREWASGPGRLAMALGIDSALNNIDLCAPDSPLFFERGEPIPDDRVLTGPRIGINVPEPWQSKPWRFWVNGDPHVSQASQGGEKGHGSL